MLQKVDTFIQQHKLLNQEQRHVIVGFSGGGDSVALLHILTQLGYQCIAAHCNFHLRGEESDRDQKFAQSFCKALNVKFVHIDFDTQVHAQAQNISIEMAARELRYNWFEQLRKQYDAQAIASGHHLDDNIETSLLNLIRGTGLKGLTGMPMKNGYIVRPLLACTQAEIQSYLQAHQLNFVTDSTNLETDFVRNKIRHQLIPLMESINAEFRKTAANTLQILAETYDIFQEHISTIRDEICIREKEQLKIDVTKLKQFAHPHTILYEILKDFNFNPAQIRQINEALDAESGKNFYSKSHCALKDRNFIIVQPMDIQLVDDKSDLTLASANNIAFEIFEVDEQFTISRDRYKVHLDAEKLSFPLKVRTWQAGDYFYPLGMKGKKKLSDFFIDLKINLFDKAKVQVVVSGEDIVWVVGWRLDERFKVSATTKSVVEIWDRDSGLADS